MKNKIIKELWSSFKSLFGFISKQKKFDIAFEVFKDEIIQINRECNKDLGTRLRKLAENYNRSIIFNHFNSRLECYKENLSLYKDKIIDNLKNTILVNCDELHLKNIQILRRHVIKMYDARCDRAYSNENAYLASIGKQNDLKLISEVIKGVFDSAKFDCSDKIESYIRKSNLSIKNDSYRSKKEKTISVFNSVIVYIATFIVGFFLGLLFSQLF